ncbi:MAG: BatD family protein, partial [Pseudomonadota bacterium]
MSGDHLPLKRNRTAWLTGLLTALCAFLLTTLSLPAAAALRTFVEPRLLDEMETVRLTIRAEGTGQSAAPDLTTLDRDFEVLGSQTSSRISSINGRTIASVEYQISLRPKRTGELEVPSLTIGNEQSEAVQIVVRPLDPRVKETIANMVFFETDLSRNPVYVQAETVLTRRLFYSQGVQIYSDLPGVPEIANAVVIPLGETQSRSVLRGGQRYGVIEQRFAIFPEESGSLEIPAISVTSSVRLQSGGRTRRSGIRVSTETEQVQVLPIPPAYPSDAAWLPATDVELTQRWTPDVTSVDVGEPLEFEVTVEATGNRGSAIPPTPLPLPENQFKIYPEAPAMDETADKGTVTGERREQYALIPTAPGTVSVPELTVTWWDTNADRLRVTQAAVPALTIVGTATVEAQAPEPSVPETIDPAPAEMPTGRSIAWVPIITALVLALLLAGLITLAYQRYGHRLAPLIGGLRLPGSQGSLTQQRQTRSARQEL